MDANYLNQIQDEIRKIYYDFESSSRNGNRIAIASNFRQIMIVEMKILSHLIEKRNMQCTAVNKIKEPFGARELQKILQNHNHQDHKFFEWLFCSFNSAYITIEKEQINDKIIYNNKTNVKAVLDSLSDMTLLSESGNFGTVWKTKIRGLSNVTYIKTDKNIAEFDKHFLKHEFFVGYQLNSLRKCIPNFMYVYGLFECKKVEGGSPCQPSENEWGPDYNVDYLLMEKIKDAFPLTSILTNEKEKISHFQIMSIYFQVILSIKLAWERFGFTHYDLHTSNVVLESTPNDEFVLIEYKCMQKTYYVKSNIIARIIDYGLSHVEVENMHFGNLNIGRKMGFNADESSPMWDIYKFAGTIMYDLVLYEHYDLVSRLKYLLTMFSSFKNITNDKNFVDQIIEENNEEDFFFSRFTEWEVANSLTPFEDNLEWILDRDKSLSKFLIFDEKSRPDIPILNKSTKEVNYDEKFNKIVGDLSNVKLSQKRERN
tara:strand:- start:79 stop:1533 length:1455 start_codon:yes stop_codon:yes gene_type:complete